MLGELERIAGQQSARYAASGSPSDIDDLRQEGISEMLGVICSKHRPENREAYLSGVCKRAMATWWGDYKGRQDVAFNEGVAGWEKAPDHEGAIDKRRFMERLRAKA